MKGQHLIISLLHSTTAIDIQKLGTYLYFLQFFYSEFMIFIETQQKRCSLFLMKVTTSPTCQIVHNTIDTVNSKKINPF